RLKDLLAGEIDGEHRVGEGNAPSLEMLEQANGGARGFEAKNGHHELGHWVMKIQDDLGAEEFGNSGAEDQEVRHVVDVDEIEAPGQRTHGEQEERDQEERRVLKTIPDRSAAVASKWEPLDVDPVEGFSRAFLRGFPEADELDLHAFVDKGFGRPTWSVIVRVIREE